MGNWTAGGMANGLLARGVFVGILCLTAILERLQFQLKATESSTWWASNGRDVINTFSLAVNALGLELMGFRGPECLLISGTLVILLTGLQAPLEKSHHGTLASLGVSVGLGLPILLVPQTVAAFFGTAVKALFP